MKGYKKTKIGVIPKEWEVKKLGEIGSFFSGGTPSTHNKNYYNGDIPFIGSGNIKDNEVNQFITKEALENSSAKLVEKGDLLYALYGATSGEVGISKVNGAINQAILCIRSNQNIYFLYQYLKYNKNKIISTYLQGGQGNLSAKIIKNLKIPLPPLKEQQKIAEILSTWDEAIEKQESLIKEKENLKKGLMQQLLTGKVRFKEFSEEWKEVKLSEVLKERKEYSQKGFEFEHISLTKEGVVPKTERYERDFLVRDNTKKYKITYLNDICYNPANLKFGVICKNEFGTGIFSPIYVTFEVNEKHDVNYIGYLVTTKDFINKVRKYEQGTVYERMAVSPQDFLKFKTKLPPLKEQQKIAEVLSTIDKEIELLKDELNELKNQKKGLMQKLLSGEVRVKV